MKHGFSLSHIAVVTLLVATASAGAQSDSSCATAQAVVVTGASGGILNDTRFEFSGGIGGSDAIDIWRVNTPANANDVFAATQGVSDIDLFLLDESCLQRGPFASYDELQTFPALSFQQDTLAGGSLGPLNIPSGRPVFIALASFDGVEGRYFGGGATTVKHVGGSPATPQVPPGRAGAFVPPGVAPTPAPAPNLNFTGTWYDPAQSGMGVQIVQTGNTLGGVLYYFGADGESRWLSWVDRLEQFSLETAALGFRGAPLGTPWTNPRIQRIGTLVLTVRTADRLDLSFVLDRGVEGILQLEPFTLP